MIPRRRFFYRIAITLLGVSLITAIPGRSHAGADEAGEFVASLTSQAIEQLTDSSLPKDERKQRFRALFTENFDLRVIGRFVLGRYWRRASSEARRDFLNVFEDVMVQRFAPQFAGYAGTRFNVGVVRPLQEQGQFIVTSTVTTAPGEPLQVDWRVREKDGAFKILDVVGQGVSMVLTLRSEYTSVIKSSGGHVEGLITMLRERIKNDKGDGATTSASK